MPGKKFTQGLYALIKNLVTNPSSLVTAASPASHEHDI